jgi:ribonuclease III
MSGLHLQQYDDFLQKLLKSDRDSGPAGSTICKPLPQGLKVPSFFATTPMDVSDIPKTLPPLPEVLDGELEMAAFTHHSVETVKGKNYQLLEWIGDSYLHIISTVLITQTFHIPSEGDLSLLREILVRNSTLAGYSAWYQFEKRAKVPPQVPKKVWGDIFEAYVAAIILSDPVDGLPRTISWLKALWAASLERQLRQLAQSKAQPLQSDASKLIQEKTMKERLAEALLVPGIKISYEARDKMKTDRDHKLSLFTVDAFLIGWGERTFLGSGTARGKGEAGNKAAQMALANKKLIKVFSDKKKAYLTRREPVSQ